jgi:hypothetical protein
VNGDGDYRSSRNAISGSILAIVDRQGKVVANIEGNQFRSDQFGDLTEAVLDSRNRIRR